MAKTKQSSIPLKVPFWQNDKLMAWVFFGIAFLLYLQTRDFDYALDDRAVTYQNEFVKKGFGGIGDILHTFYWRGFWTSNAGLFRPVSLILFAIEWQLFPNHPHVFHFVNVLLYATSALLLFKLLRVLFRDYSLTFSWMVTLLWIVFPAHTEVVANIKSADEILSMIFFLLSMQQLLKWQENDQWKALLFSGLFFFLALLSKEGAALFLPLMFLALYLFRKTELNKMGKPVAVLLTFTALWFAWHTAVISGADTAKIQYTYHDNSLIAAPDFISRFATAMQMQGKYLLKSFTGFPLSYDYSYNENPYVGLGDPVALLSIAVCIALLVIAVRRFKKDPLIAFGILFYFVTFALTSNVFILIGATMADRFLFVPSLGFCIVLVALVLKLMKAENVKQLHAGTLYVLVPLALLYSIRSYTRSADWEFESTLFTADVESAPGSARVHYNYGTLLMGNAAESKDENEKSRLNDEAYTQFTAAVKIDSLDWQSMTNLGVVEYRRKNYAASAEWSRRMLKIVPNDYGVISNMADALVKAGKYDSAIAAYTRVVDMKQTLPATWVNLGAAYLYKGDTAKAIETFEKGTLVEPDYVDNWDKLANVAGMARQYEKSNKAFLKLAEFHPQDLHNYQMLYTNDSLMGNMEEAARYARKFREILGR